MKAVVLQAQKDVTQNFTAQSYEATYNTRVSKELRDKSNTSSAWEVQFECRPYIAERHGIETFPQDFEKLDLETFRWMYGNGQRTNVDPFHIERIEIKPSELSRFLIADPRYL